MGQTKPARQPPKERLGNNREVSLGFTKKISIDEAHRCPQCAQPVCLSGCPLGVDILGFIRLLREGDAAASLERIKQDNPFPAICGRICPAPCESACIFFEEDSAISIRALERYASDFGVRSNQKLRLAAPTGKRVAIVGSGPSGMAAASILMKEGFKVCMYEAANEPGGVLRYGIPEFRLPTHVIEAQFSELKALGLEMKTNILVGRMISLNELSNAYDAVLLTTGASLPNFSILPGEHLGGVYYAEEFLMRLQILSKENVMPSASALLRSNKTVVVGKGYAALDSARLAVRLGQQVNWVFKGLEEEIAVSPDDLQQAVEEGIVIKAPLEVLSIEAKENHFAAGVKCRALEIVEGLGGLSLQVSKEPEIFLEAQTVILANGQKPNSILSHMSHQLRSKDNGAIWTEENTFKTSMDKVYAAASVVEGPMTVVEAFARGKSAARQIIKQLNSL